MQMGVRVGVEMGRAHTPPSLRGKMLAQKQSPDGIQSNSSFLHIRKLRPEQMK